MQLRAGYRVGSSLQGEPDRIYGQNVNTVAGGQVSGYRGLPNSRTASYREYLPRRSTQEMTSIKHPAQQDDPLEYTPLPKSHIAVSMIPLMKSAFESV